MPRKRTDPSALKRRSCAVVMYVTEAEADVFNVLAGPGKPYHSASDMARLGFALLVRGRHPDLSKNLRDDLLKSLA